MPLDFLYFCCYTLIYYYDFFEAVNTGSASATKVYGLSGEICYFLRYELDLF